MMGSSYAAHMLWLSTLLGWLTKVLTMKFCGGRALAVTRRFFMGVILAESVAIAASTVLGLFGTHLGAIFLPN
jgi:hypothetical protein